MYDWCWTEYNIQIFNVTKSDILQNPNFNRNPKHKCEGQWLKYNHIVQGVTGEVQIYLSLLSPSALYQM